MLRLPRSSGESGPLLPPKKVLLAAISGVPIGTVLLPLLTPFLISAANWSNFLMVSSQFPTCLATIPIWFCSSANVAPPHCSKIGKHWIAPYSIATCNPVFPSSSSNVTSAPHCKRRARHREWFDRHAIWIGAHLLALLLRRFNPSSRKCCNNRCTVCSSPFVIAKWIHVSPS